MEAINPKIHAKFKKLDKNKDGFIEKSEAKRNKLLNKEFNKIAKEGKLDEASFAAWETSHAKPAKKKAAQ